MAMRWKRAKRGARKITKTGFIPKCASDVRRELLRISDFVEGCVVEHAFCAAASVPIAAVCARRRAAETREAMMSRSGCKESKVATGAFAAPSQQQQQQQHTPSEYGRRTRCSQGPASSPRRGNGKRRGKMRGYYSRERRENDGAVVYYTASKQWRRLLLLFFFSWPI